MLWLLRLQFMILGRGSFFAHFEIPQCHHAKNECITIYDISCSSTVPQVTSKLRSRHLSTSMPLSFLQLNLTRSPNQGCCLHAMHGARTCLALMPGTLLCFRHRWAEVICCRLLKDVEPNGRLCPKIEVAIPDACYCRFDSIHETPAVVRPSLKKRLMKSNED